MTSVFGMGLTEILLVGIVILLLFSPKELPGMIKSVARVYGSLRRTAEDFRAQVMEAEELREPFDEIRDAYRGTKAELAQAQGAARRELAKARLEARMAEQRLVRLAREEERIEKDKSQQEAVAAGEAPATAAIAAEPPAAGPPGVRPSAPPTKRPPTPAVDDGDDPNERGAA
ncbi:MAG: twin-arginine translocase TatA/TatE family subunit [Nannocystaceae bacterium]